MARHRRMVLAAWMIVLAVSAALYPSLRKVLSEPDYGIENSQSWRAEQALQSPGFRGAGSEQDAVVFFSTAHRVGDPAYRATVSRVLHAARSHTGVREIVSPYSGPAARAQISADGHAALARLAIGGGTRERFARAGALQSAIAQADGSHADVRAWLTGYSPLSRDISQTESTDGERAEAIGAPLALLVLVLALGAIGAAVVPLLLAGSGVLLTSGVIAVLGRLVAFDVFLLTIVTMIGVGIGIDYSLFVVSRFREELARLPRNARAERRLIAQAVGVAMATSGRTVLYSGVVVALSLTSLLVIQAPLFREFVIGTSAVVACTMVAAFTLLPAMLAQLGRHVNAGRLPDRLQPADARSAEGGTGGWAGWALAVMRRPALVAVAVLALLGAAIAPVLGLRSGIAFDIPALAQTPSGHGARLLERWFSPGLTSPLEVVLTGGPPARGARPAPAGGARSGTSGGPPSGTSGTSGTSGAAGAARMLVAQLKRDRRVSGLAARSYRSGVLLTVVSSVPLDSSAAQGLVRRIRTRLAVLAKARYGVDVLVGGSSAQSADAARETTDKLPLVLAVTLGIALLFLLAVFRSVVLPIKAVAMNLLATGAALGLVVLVFQDGHGERLLGFSSPGYIQAYLPLSMFVLLFGLSMDYEIFLIRRIQEAWRQTADNRWSVASGVEHTARPISAAAAIMVAVFGSNMTAQMLELKQFGFALAVAIAIDATLVRLALVPALMCLLGGRNWWLPARLERLVPRLEID